MYYYLSYYILFSVFFLFDYANYIYNFCIITIIQDNSYSYSIQIFAVKLISICFKFMGS